MFDVEVKKVDPEFKDRLYFVNNFGNAHGADTRAVWNNPEGGALQWSSDPLNWIVDTKGEFDGLWTAQRSSTSIRFMTAAS